MKSLGWIFLFALIPMIALAERGLPDTTGNRLAAAERYLSVAPIGDMLRETVVESSKNLPPGVQAVYVDLMTESLRVEAIERIALVAMTKQFTVDELNALAEFYGSAEGKSVMKKFGGYMADLMPALQQEIQRAHYEVQRKFQKSQ